MSQATRHWTIWILVGTAVLLVVWDVVAYFGAGPAATISRVMLDWAGAHPIVPFMLGVIAGHFFWPQR